MKTLTGIPVSSGIAIGKAFRHTENDFSEIPRYSLGKAQVESELKRFGAAKEEAVTEVKALCQQANREMSKDQAAIFEAHLMMLDDPE
jgi:phosphotransferase system enzyme I (PtsI)